MDIDTFSMQEFRISPNNQKQDKKNGHNHGFQAEPTSSLFRKQLGRKNPWENTLKQRAVQES